MRTVEAKLADWHRLYKELAQAQSRLAERDSQPAALSGQDDLETEVARLQRDCDDALNVVQTLLDRKKAQARQGQEA